MARGIADVALGTAVRVIQRRADPLHRHQPLVITLGTLYLYGGGALLLSGMAGATGYEGIGGFPDSFTAFANLTLAGLPLPLVLFAIITFFFWLLTIAGALAATSFYSGKTRAPRAMPRCR